MRRKLTKTIILIVFVVFLGIKNVSAEEDCYYHFYSNAQKKDTFLHIRVKESGGGEVVKYYSQKYDTGEYEDLGTENLTVTSSMKSCLESIHIYSDGAIYPPYEHGYSGTAYTQIDSLNSSPNSPFHSSNVGNLKNGADSPVSCGKITNIPANIPKTTRIIYLLLQVLVPVVLVVLGMLDLAKAVMAQKEDEIKRGQQTFVKRLIAAAIVFFVFAVVKMLTSFLQDSTTTTDCLNCFISGQCVEAEAEEGEGE